jgi:hypothetical protein
MGESLHIHIYYNENRAWPVGLKAGFDPDGGRWRQVAGFG